MKTTRFLAMFFLCLPTTLLADSLGAFREAELSMFSQCPDGQSLAIVGDAPAHMIVTYLSSSSAVTAVERDRLTELTGEVCADFVDPSTQVSAGNMIFATHLFEVTGNLGSLGGSFTIRGIRSDNGVEIYNRTYTISSIDELDASVAESITGITEAVLGNPVQCKDKFDFVVEEQVSLQCSGNLGLMPMSYAVQADINLEFVLNDVKNQIRGTEQQLNGVVRVLPSTVTTILKSTLGGGGDCPEVLKTTRTILIPLKERTRSAQLGLTISQNGRDPWRLRAKITSHQPLFEAQATINSAHVASDCDTPASPEYHHDMPFKYLELNLFQFAVQEFSPLCSEQSESEMVFLKMPSFAVTPLPPHGLDCQKNNGFLFPRWRRQF